MFHTSIWYSESIPNITIAFSSSPKCDRSPFYTFVDWFSAYFRETKEKNCWQDAETQQSKTDEKVMVLQVIDSIAAMQESRRNC